MKIRLAAVVVTLAAFFAPLSAQTLGTNLLINGDAEAGAPSDTGNDVVPAPGWTTVGSATVGYYDSDISHNNFPALDDPGPDQRGLQLFSGGPDNPLSSMSQTVDVTTLASKIDGSTVHATLAGYLGGFSSQEDHTTVTEVFLDGSGNSLGKISIGPVTAEDRGGVSEMLLRSQDAAVPALTRSIAVTMIFERAEGNYNDGYADNISLVLNDTATPAAGSVRIYPAFYATPVGTTGAVVLNPGVEVTYPTVTGTNYQVERSTDLKTWTNFGSQVPGTGSTVAIFDRRDLTPRQFYRVQTL